MKIELIVEERIAAEAIRRARRAQADLDDLLRLAMDSGMPDEEFRLFRRTIGRVMGEIYTELLSPLFEQFPHLTPPELIPPKSCPDESG